MEVGSGCSPVIVSIAVALFTNIEATFNNLKYDIRVNAVYPTWVDTPMMERSHEWIPQMGKIIEKMSPLGRMAATDEVADVIVLPCSSSASYVNDIGLLVDAGLTLSMHTKCQYLNVCVKSLFQTLH